MTSTGRGLWRDIRQAFWPNRDPETYVLNVPTVQQRQAYLDKVEGSGFNGLIWAVAASGFLTDSYNLFASNVVLPALAYLYWTGTGHTNELAFNISTLAGSAMGQLLFGWLADVFGRQALYGVELIIVIVSTVGLLQCSPGYVDPVTGDHTWSITVWLLIWRTIMGLGIGAEYPLSSCIAAEWTSTESRGRMLSSVFVMQPIGQLCAYGAGLTALRIWGSTPADIDKMWRYVIGVGAAPTILALGFRLTIWESGRYTYEVRNNINQARVNTSRVLSNGDGPANQNASANANNVTLTSRAAGSQFNTKEIHEYLIKDGNWLYLLGTSLCWFLLDFVYYGLGFNNPALLAKLWSSGPLSFPANSPWWLTSSDLQLSNTILQAEVVDGVFTNPAIAEDLIHNVLEDNMTHAIYTVCIASIVGCLAMIYWINKIDRKKTLIWTFGLLAVVLLVASLSFKALFHHPRRHIILIVYWVLISGLFSFGPNTLTFIIPAEIFPTKYRCTLYGIAACSGKLGSILVQVVLLSQSSIGDPNSTALWGLLLGFALCMALGVVVTAVCIPQVQFRSSEPPYKRQNYSLEQLAPGRKDQVKEGTMAMRRIRPRRDSANV